MKSALTVVMSNAQKEGLARFLAELSNNDIARIMERQAANAEVSAREALDILAERLAETHGERDQ